MDRNDTDSSSRDDEHNETGKHEIEIEAATQVTDPRSPNFNPTNFLRSIKVRVLITGFVCAFNSSLGTSMPSGAYEAISQHFSVTSKTQLALLNSLNVVGLILGPILFGPLSECIGRRPIMIVSYLGFVVFTLACSGAPTYPVLLVFRLLSGINAAAPFAIIGGLYADIFDDHTKRGLSIAVFMLMNTSGVIFGPIISGFASRISWRWSFWAASIMAAPGIPLALTLPETFAPVLRARNIRQRVKAGETLDESASTNVISLDMHKIFLRPFTLVVKEPVLLSSSLYLALAYAVLYLMFQIYPVVFQDMYGLPPGMAGLAYLPVFVGALLAVLIFCTYGWWYDRSRRAGKAWAQNEVYRRLPLTCLASPCMVIGLFWLGWTSWETFSPVVPSLGGLFFGMGFQLIFMSMINFITDVFRQGSASAHAAASCIRSTAAVLVPLAADSMYRNLGIHWTSSLLGFLSLAMGVIPFVFIFFGKRLLNRTSET